MKDSAESKISEGEFHGGVCLEFHIDGESVEIHGGDLRFLGIVCGFFLDD